MSQRVILTAAPESEAAALVDLRRAATGRGSELPEIDTPPAHRTSSDSSVAVSRHLAPGVVLLALPGSFDELAAALRRKPPIFIRHLQPVQREVPLAGELSDLQLLTAAALELASDLDPRRSFSVQTRLADALNPESASASPYGRYEINERLSTAIQAATGAPLEVRAPQQVVSVMIAPPAGYIGLSTVEENLSAWAGGAIRFAREPDQVSRSEFKLLEALQVFGLGLPETGAALDLGASPGGWTRLLRRAGLAVTAVDPGDLDPRIADDPGVQHVRATAQEFRCRPEQFAVIVNDMRMDARDSARLMLDYAACLQPDGFAVMTLKLPHRQPERVAHQAIGLLLRRYELIGARQLFHNRSEITVALKRRLKHDGRDETREFALETGQRRSPAS